MKNNLKSAFFSKANFIKVIIQTVTLVWMFQVAPVFAVQTNGTVATPYIDELKKELPDVSNGSSADGSYVESQKKKLLETAPKDDKPYLEKLKEMDPEYYKKPESTGSYSEFERGLLAPVPPKKSAIQSVKDGTSDLHPDFGKPEGKMMGFKIGTVGTRKVTFTGGSTGQTFISVYKPGFTPEILGYYEYSPLHSEVWGSLGFQILGGLAFQSGTGVFRHELTNPVNAKSFGAISDIKFQFFTMPLMVGGVYRLNIAKYLKPYIFAGPAYIGYVEMRNDEKKNHKGTSKALITGAGVSISLNGLAKQTAWEVHDATGAKNYYLTLDFTKYSTFSGLVRFNSSVLALGFAFEH